MKLSINQIVLERATFAHRSDYLTLLPSVATPEGAVALSVEVGRSTEDASLALVRLMASSAEGALYEFSVAYVLLLGLEYDPGEIISPDLDRRLVATGAPMLFPFVRETVANLTARGRFGPTWLAPTNFNDIAQSASPTATPAAQP